LVTGEGRFDKQSLRGKVVALAEARWRAAGVTQAVALMTPAMLPDEAVAHAAELLTARVISSFPDHR
jgi:glycerate kinase